MTKRSTLLAWAFGLILLLLHHDFWRGSRTEIYWGFLPEELAYRLLWMLLCFAYLVFFTAVAWGDDDS